MTFSEGSGDTPVLLMKTANVREGDNFSLTGFFYGLSLWALLFQREMGSRRMLVGEIGPEETFQVAVVEYDDVIEALTPNRSDQSLALRVLPG